MPQIGLFLPHTLQTTACPVSVKVTLAWRPEAREPASMSLSSPTFHLINHMGSALRIPEPSFQSAIVSSQSLLLQLSLVPLLPTTSVTPALLS